MSWPQLLALFASSSVQTATWTTEASVSHAVILALTTFKQHKKDNIIAAKKFNPNVMVEAI